MTYKERSEETEVTSAAKKIRVQLDFEPDDFETIKALKKSMGLGTRAELFRSGIRVLRWMFEKRRQGCTIVALTPENRLIEPEFDFFERSPVTSHEKLRNIKSKEASEQRQQEYA